MITKKNFLNVVDSSLDRDLKNPENEAQLKAVLQENTRVLQIVAGPGSGKTSVLVLRALRYVFVEDILPENIVLTTFTRKAARELRTRWLDWATICLDSLKPGINKDSIDINRCRIDTLDSIIQQTLTDYRLPGGLAPIVVENSASNLILKRVAFQDYFDPNVLNPLLGRYTFDGDPPRNRGEALRGTKRLIERLIQDRVDLGKYSQSGQAQKLIVEMLEQYRRNAIETNVFDFAVLEDQFLNRLSNGTLGDWQKDLRVLLIDEYQDTNPLQEAIYFQMVVGMPNLSVTIVGDDDQSMYRFRGGSVELFNQFAIRCKQATGRETERVDMIRNFRSRPEIVRFYNNHIAGDPGFFPARINPPKPLVVDTRRSETFPVLGMFRPDRDSLAADITIFFDKLIRGKNVSIGKTGLGIRMVKEGALGDLVFLSHSIEEQSYDRYTSTSKERFPGILRRQLEGKGFQVFNPRGQALRNVPDVCSLLGLILIAIDPNDTIVEDVIPTNEARYFLLRWKEIAKELIDRDPSPKAPDGGGLGGFIQNWQRVGSGEIVEGFPSDWPVLELVFKLLSWFPDFQREAEHQVWLEAVTRIITSAGLASPYRMSLLQNTSKRNQGDHVRLSRLSLVRDALLAIAANEVEVDEDIMPSIPRDRLQLMTIHQAKGLEFPFVIVDVGTQFTRNAPTQRFLRFPDNISNVVQAEDDVESYLRGPLRMAREGIDRTFDDLVRLYYVAYSRPQSVLMLVGCEKCLGYGKGSDYSQGAIPNIALGWRRDNSWPWRQEFSGRRPPIKINPPFVEI